MNKVLWWIMGVLASVALVMLSSWITVLFNRVGELESFNIRREGQVGTLSAQMGDVLSRLGRTDGRLDRIEDKLDRILSRKL